MSIRRETRGRSRLDLALSLSAAMLLTSGCATHTVPPAPVTVAHAEFVYPAVPAALKGSPGADQVSVGWRYLQSDYVNLADREFSQALKRNAALYPARTGQGYVALAKREFSRALADFDAALKV